MDKDLLAAAQDLRDEDPKRFAELAVQYPELAAEAAKPRPLRYARGTGNSKGCEPYRCWDKNDRGRWNRTSGAASDDATDAVIGGDDSEYQGAWASAPGAASEDPDLDIGAGDASEDPDLDIGASAGSLLDLEVATSGGWVIATDATDHPIKWSSQLEVCRVCGEPLKLSRDAEGYAHRDRGQQPKYCGSDCRKAVKEARARAKRAADKPAPPEAPFSLDGVYVAGVGKVDVEPAVWNRQQPRSDPRAYEPVVPKVERLPWLHHNARSRTRKAECQEVVEDVDRYRLDPHRLVQSEQSAGLPRPTVSKPDRIARRYGTGGTPPAPVLTPGWDRVVISWRDIPPSEQAPDGPTEP
ncbi:MAG: hypothetical protein E6R00_00875 [Gammaproteobacteria bacterium]|nr:MAG: hypothetical protein E6R00_00875 [Gammaproteobacteria bacterium]